MAQSQSYEALTHYETAVSRCTDHPAGTVGLCNILLDIASQKLPPQNTTPLMTLHLAASEPPASSAPSPDPILSKLQAVNKAPAPRPGTEPSLTPLGIPQSKASPFGVTLQPQSNGVNKASRKRDSPEELDRLAARDRAYGLLSTLTKLGTGWDYSEAWFALARAYEEGGQLDKEREALWWCVELEDTRPIRRWSDVGGRGYVL